MITLVANAVLIDERSVSKQLMQLRSLDPAAAESADRADGRLGPSVLVDLMLHSAAAQRILILKMHVSALIHLFFRCLSILATLIESLRAQDARRVLLVFRHCLQLMTVEGFLEELAVFARL